MAYDLKGEPVSKVSLGVFLCGNNLAGVRFSLEHEAMTIETEACHLTIFMDLASAEKVQAQLSYLLYELNMKRQRQREKDSQTEALLEVVQADIGPT